MVLLAALTAASIAAGPAPSFKEALRDMGLAYVGSRNYRGETFLPPASRGDDPAFWRLTASDGPRRVRLEATRGVGPEELERAVREFEARLAMSAEGDAAYPGMLTRRYETPKHLRAEVLRPGSPGERIYRAYATPRLTYGPGARDLIGYRALIAFRYLRANRVVLKIEFFVPSSEPLGSGDEAELSAFRARQPTPVSR